MKNSRSDFKYYYLSERAEKSIDRWEEEKRGSFIQINNTAKYHAL